MTMSYNVFASVYKVGKSFSQNVSMLSLLGKFFIGQYTAIFSSENRFGYFMQSASKEDNLHEMSSPVFWEREEKNITIIC